MQKQFLTFLLVFCCASIKLLGQDIHFSQFNRSYLNLNPALTGNFDGDYRFNGNFKNQWSSVAEPYQTFSFAADLRSPLNALPQLHLGILLFNDEAGLGGLKTTSFMLSGAYSLKLNYDSTLVAMGGLQIGFQARSINFNLFNFDRQYNGTQFDQNLPTGENFDQSSYMNFSLNTGLSITYKQERRKTYSAGIAFYNLSSPNQSFEGSNIPLDLRLTATIAADYLINNEIDVLPTILFSTQGTYRELIFGSELRYRLNGTSSRQRNLYGGVFYRNRDALILSTGLDYDQWHFGASYDINVSDLEIASNNRGGLELAVTYIFKDFKPNIRRYKVCPNFM